MKHFSRLMYKSASNGRELMQSNDTALPLRHEQMNVRLFRKRPCERSFNYLLSIANAIVTAVTFSSLVEVFKILSRRSG